MADLALQQEINDEVLQVPAAPVRVVCEGVGQGTLQAAAAERLPWHLPPPHDPFEL